MWVHRSSSPQRRQPTRSHTARRTPTGSGNASSKRPSGRPVVTKARLKDQGATSGRPLKEADDIGPPEVAPEAYPPTYAEPGSQEKVRILIERAEQGLPLWHPHDRRYYDQATDRAAG